MTMVRGVLEASPNAVLVVDSEGVIRQANRNVRDVLEYRPGELEGMVVEDLLREEDRTHHVGYREAYMESPEPRPMGRELDLYALTKSGDDVPVEISLGPIRDDGDLFVVATIADISKRKNRERELQRQNERLDEFASIVSHDLRNPLNVIEGRVELVRDELESEDLDAISRAVDRMNELIDGLLAVAQNGDELEDPEPIDLDEIATTCWQNVSTKQASLAVETSQTVMADRNQIQQLFENLFRNAIEHGGSEVTITVSDLVSGSGFYVADDGHGIPDDEREQVFVAGYSSSASGSGFGLAIVKQIAGAHEWDLSLVHSHHGGARFEFRDVRVVG